MTQLFNLSPDIAACAEPPAAMDVAIEGREPAATHVVLERDTRCHILFIIDELCEIGGAERVLFKMIRSLPQDLFRCSLITFRTNEETAGCRISCPLYVLPLNRTYDRNAWRVARQISAFVRRENVSIVHTFFETSDLWAGPIAKFSGCPVLVSSRRDLGILRSWKHRIGYRFLKGFFDSVLAVSPQVRDFCIREDGLDPSKVHTLFNGLEMESVAAASGRAAMRAQMGIAEDVPLITTIGNIRRVKGIDVLIDAARLVCHRYPNALFLVAGRKSEEDHCRELEQAISTLGLQANFKLLGSREDVLSILRMSDIFCLPSRSEGFSNALIEAMACRLPCVATDVGGNREVLSDGETGFLVPPEDSALLASALMRLLADRGRAGTMGLNGERVVRSHFTAEAMMKNLVNFYQGLLAAKEVRS
jgi:glycosyltransferase involved in cell wall biosynthesis